MAFESLSDRLNSVFKDLSGKGRLSELDVKNAMREVRMALLEADVNFKVVKDFVKRVSERAVGAEVLESLSPTQMVIKIVNEEMTKLMGDETVEIECAPESVHALREGLTEKGYNVISAESEMIPSTYTTLTDEEHIKKMNLLLEHLEENDDVQNVYHNWEMPDEE